MKHKKPSGYPAYKPALDDVWKPPTDEDDSLPDGLDLFNAARKKRLAEMELNEDENQLLTRFGITANVVRQIRSQNAAGRAMWRIAQAADVTWDTVNRVIKGGKAEADDE